MNPNGISGLNNRTYPEPPYQPPVDRMRVAAPPSLEKSQTQQLPKFGHVIRSISNVIPEPQPQSFQVPQYGNPFYQSFTSMCNPFSYHLQYGPNTQTHPPVSSQYPSPIQGRPIPNPRAYNAHPSNQKPSIVESRGMPRRSRPGQSGRRSAPRRRKICEKFLRLPYSPKNKLNICLNNKQHIELRDPSTKVRYKYIKYRNITAPTGELVFKEHCCAERKKQKCNARIIERLKDGFCCLQGKHLCGGNKDFDDFTTGSPTLGLDDDDDDDDDEEEEEIDVREDEESMGFIMKSPIPPPSLILPNTLLPPQFPPPSNSPVSITGILPYSSSPRTTVHIFVKCHPIVLNTSMLRIYFDNTPVENQADRILIPCLIPTKHSVWRGDYQSDYCVYCVVPELPHIEEPTLVDIQVCVKLKNNQLVLGRSEKIFEYYPPLKSKKRKMY